jgi:hypothetical protein
MEKFGEFNSLKKRQSNKEKETEFSMPPRLHLPMMKTEVLHPQPFPPLLQ